MIIFFINIGLKIFSTIYSYSTFMNVYKVKVRIYTYWISNELKFLGEDSLIHFPISLRGGKYIAIGKKTGIGARGIINAWDMYNGEHFIPEIVVGNNTWIGEDCHITAINKIHIGDNVLIGRKVTITDNSHGKTDFNSLAIIPVLRPLYSKGPVIIENNVWIGDKATILPGVRIGRNAIIGANSVVTKDVDDYSIVCGNPARVISRN